MSADGQISLVFASDEVMAMPLTVAIGSVLSTRKDDSFLDIHVLSCGISKKSKARAEYTIAELGKGRAQLTWHDIVGQDAVLLQRLFTDSERPYPPANYARLLVGKFLPAEIERVIYMDIDTLTRRDLRALWETAFDGAHVLAIRDLPHANGQIERIMATLDAADQLRHGFGSGPDYFQAGVLVLDLAAFRSDRVDALITILQRYPQLNFPDQDALNIVFARHSKLIDPRWNSMSAIYWYDDYSQSPYDAEMFRALQKDPFIVHYSGRPKPWEDGCDHELAHLWHQVHAMMPWMSRRRTILTRIIDRIPRARRMLGKRIRRILGL